MSDPALLAKTFELLRNIQPGTYVADPAKCYDDEEIEALGRILHRLLYAPSELRKKLQAMGVNVVPADFYSEIPTVQEIEESAAGSGAQGYDYIFDRGKMVDFLERLIPFSAEFSPPVRSDVPGEYHWEGVAFSYSDAMAYYSLIRHARPRTIVEIGAGWSTLVADAALKANGHGQIICIDPWPPDFISNVDSVASVHQRAVQTFPQSFFDQALGDGDILFIDSTHTVKQGSDCLYIYLKLLPRLAASVFVHSHDIYLPNCLPLEFMRDRQIYWTEQYLLMAYLIDNSRTTVLYGSTYHARHNPERLTAFMHGRFPAGGASLWFYQQAQPAGGEQR